MTKLPIGLQLYSVRDAMKEDFAGTIKAVAEMGYNQVEFAGLFGHTAEEVKAICAEAGVTPISAHLSSLLPQLFYCWFPPECFLCQILHYSLTLFYFF